MEILTRYADSSIVKRLRERVLPNLKYLLTKTTGRKCGCCDKTSVFLQFGPGPLNQVCTRCSASFRYELLARICASAIPWPG